MQEVWGNSRWPRKAVEATALDQKFVEGQVVEANALPDGSMLDH